MTREGLLWCAGLTGLAGMTTQAIAAYTAGPLPWPIVGVIGLAIGVAGTAAGALIYRRVFGCEPDDPDQDVPPAERGSETGGSELGRSGRRDVQPLR